MNIPQRLTNRSEIRLQPIAERESAVIEYRRILVALIREIRIELDASVMLAYKADRAFATDSESWLVTLRSVAAEAVRRSVVKVAALMGRESAIHAKRVKAVIKRGTGIAIDESLIVSSRKEIRLARAYIEHNTSQIKGLSDDVLKRVEGAVLLAKINGDSPTRLADTLRDQYRIAGNRAKYIAVNQLSSLNADLTEMRHRHLGIDWYEWVHRGDSRVRSLHRRLGDRRAQYKWGQRTGAENGAAPGKAPNCRCIARGIIPPSTAKARRDRFIEGFAAFAAGVVIGSQEPESETEQ